MRTACALCRREPNLHVPTEALLLHTHGLLVRGQTEILVYGRCLRGGRPDRRCSFSPTDEMGWYNMLCGICFSCLLLCVRTCALFLKDGHEIKRWNLTTTSSETGLTPWTQDGILSFSLPVCVFCSAETDLPSGPARERCGGGGGRGGPPFGHVYGEDR